MKCCFSGSGGDSMIVLHLTLVETKVNKSGDVGALCILAEVLLTMMRSGTLCDAPKN